METKNILIGLGVVAVGVGVYVYLNKNKARRRPTGGGTNTNTGGTDTADTDTSTDTSIDTTDNATDIVDTGDYKDYGYGYDYTDTPTTNTGTNVNTVTPDDVQIINAPSMTEEEISIFTNSPNPRQSDFNIDIFNVRGGGGSTSGSLNTNPKTGYSTNTGGTSGGSSSTPNYSVEFCGLKM